MDAPFTNREVRIMFGEIKSELINMNKELTEVKTQTTKTNGRVNKLERTVTILTTAIIVVVCLKFPDIINVIKLLV